MSEPKPPLFASFEKIKAAERKVTELTAMINAYIESTKSYVRVDFADGLFYLVAGFDREPAPDMGLKVGEIGCELRDALDKMTVALAIKNGRGTSGVGFPWGGMDKTTGTPQPFPGTRHRHLEKKLTPDQWSLILAQKPHPGGNDTLWAINQIANNHKHWENLVETRAHLLNSKFTLGGTGYIDKLISNPSWPDGITRKNDTEHAIFAVSPNNTLPADGELSIYLVFGEIQPISGKVILPTLKEQVGLTKIIVETFRDAFFV